MTCDGKTMETNKRELARIGREMLCGANVPMAEAYRCGREHVLVAWLAMRFEDAEQSMIL